MSNSANSNTNDTNDDDNNNNNIVEDGGLTIVSSNKIYQNEASSSYHRTPTPPSSKAFNDRKRFPSRKNSIIKDETTAVNKNKPLASQKPHIRKRINNRNHLHQQYTFNMEFLQDVLRYPNKGLHHHYKDGKILNTMTVLI